MARGVWSVSVSVLFAFGLLLLVGVVGVHQVHAAKPITATNTWFTDCDNTIETRDNATDTTGKLCSRDKLNYRTGCCEEGVQYDCSRCSEENECCDRYEHCVSCCMGKSVVDEYMKAPDVFKVALHPETGHWEKRWDYCTGQCRITPLATIYENRYKDAFKFCYAKYPMPKNTYLQLPTGLSVEMGLRGQSCDQVCREKGKTCKEEHFSKINLCEVTQEHTGFKCRFCKMKKGPPEIGGPAVQYMAGSEYFDGTCFQEKQLYNFKCELEVVEAFNRICPCG